MLQILDHLSFKLRTALDNEPLNFTIIPKSQRSQECRVRSSAPENARFNSWEHLDDFANFQVHCSAFQEWADQTPLLRTVNKTEMRYTRLNETHYLHSHGSDWTNGPPTQFWRFHQRDGPSRDGVRKGQGAYNDALGWMTFSKFEHRKHNFRYLKQKCCEDSTFLYDTIADGADLMIIDHPVLGIYCDKGPRQD